MLDDLSPMPAFDVAVVGLGAMGSAALHHLAARGLRVIGLEQSTPGHDGGSSHGESRIIRLAYFEHPSYVPLVCAAYEAWRALERRTGREILTVTGILEAGHPDSEIVAGSLASSIEHAIPHERLTGRQITARFPAFDLPADWEGVFQPDGGFLRPELAIALQVEAARADGAEVRLGVAVRAVEAAPHAVRIVMDDGEVIEAGSVILAAGAWTPDLVPDLARRLTLTRQAVAWFEPVRPELTALGRLPVFILESPEDAVYGFPDVAGSGVKAASHRPGRVLAHASDARQDGAEADARQILDTLARYLPAAAGPVRRLSTCIYTSTPDQDFVIDQLPSDPRVVVASPCSGHGFKFSILIGQILADLATTGATPHDITRFSLSRFAAPTP